MNLNFVQNGTNNINISGPRQVVKNANYVLLMSCFEKTNKPGYVPDIFLTKSKTLVWNETEQVQRTQQTHQVQQTLN